MVVTRRYRCGSLITLLPARDTRLAIGNVETDTALGMTSFLFINSYQTNK
jgi:hypothetical protein